MEIVELSIDDGLDIYSMLQRIGPDENAFRNDANGLTYEEFKDWLKLQYAWSVGEELPNGYVKQWTYWLINEAGKPVGYGKLREKATEASKKIGGNIGFAIDPTFRGKGYGTILFSMLLKKADELSIKEIYSTVEKGNWSSKMIHEKHGGQLIKDDGFRWHYLFKK